MSDQPAEIFAPFRFLGRKREESVPGFGDSFFISGVRWALLTLGVVFRAGHYLENRSLWLDEACFAVTVISRSWSEIWRNIPLAPNFAGAPLLFSLIEKASLVTLGDSEYALRLFPFLSGLGALFLFFVYVRKVLPPLAGVWALALFAGADLLVYYSAELKQYSSDVLVTLALLSFAERPGWGRLSWRGALAWAAGGVVAMWLSNASLFVLASLGLVGSVSALSRRDWPRFAAGLGVSLFWSASFYFLYKNFLSGPASDGPLLSSWKNSFLSLPPWTAAGWEELKNILWAFFRKPLGLVFPFWGFCLFVMGVAAVGRDQLRRGVFLILPFLLALAAAALHKYPFRERLVLFLLPAAVIFVARGAGELVRISGKARWVTAAALSGFLLIPTYQTSLYNLARGREKEENRTVMRYLKQHIRFGDNLVLNNEAQYQFWYYAMSLGVEHRLGELKPAWVGSKIVLGYKVGQVLDFLSEDPRGPFALFRYNLHVYNKDGVFRQLLSGDKLARVYKIYEATPLDFIRGRRVWFVFSHMDPGAQRFVLRKLDQAGRRVQEIARPGAAAYLYDFGT